MNTIADEWDEFAKHVVPPDAPDVQRVEMRVAFYAGATALLWLGARIAGFSDDAAQSVWQSLHDESAAFVHERLAEQKEREREQHTAQF